MDGLCQYHQFCDSEKKKKRNKKLHCFVIMEKVPLNWRKV